MKREFEAIISEYLGLQPAEINSALVSAQSRVRLYWTNIKTREEGLFREVYTDIPLPGGQEANAERYFRRRRRTKVFR